MSKIKYLYNNEAICTIAIYATLCHVKQLNYSKVMLIAPFLLNKQLVNALNYRVVVRSIEELMLKKGELTVNFNYQYQSLLPLTCNTLKIMDSMHLININESVIKKGDIDLDLEHITGRTKKIIKCAPKIAKLLESESSEKLYLQLRVEL